jgi:hypothetical protein
MLNNRVQSVSGLFGSEQELMADPCPQDYEPMGSIKCEEPV